MFSLLRLLIENSWLRLLNRYLKWRLRRAGIDPDSIPEIQESQRQRAELRAKYKRE